MADDTPSPEVAAAVATEDPRPYGREELQEVVAESDLTHLDSQRLGATTNVELAWFLATLDVEDRRAVLRQVNEDKASGILAEMEGELAAETVAAMREVRAARLLAELDPDDAADVVGELNEEDQARLLRHLPPKIVKELKDLLNYDPESAGGIMNPRCATIYPDMTVERAIRHIRQLQAEWEDISYIYVVDRQERLQGVVSMRALILAQPMKKIVEVMATEVRGIVSAETDREEVARKIADLNLMAVPVVSQEGILLGVVTHDDVLDILEAEATEDMQIMFGAAGDEGSSDKLIYSIRSRLPWLQINLLTAFAASGIVYLFQEQIGQLTMLAVFLPIFASMGGNAGSQVLAIVIREIALGRMDFSSTSRIVRKEFLIGLANGIAVGLAAAAVAWVLTPPEQRLMILTIVMISMVLTMAVAGLSGAFIPLLLQRMKLDPAQSSTIFLTTVTDMAGFFIFLALGSWLLL